MFLYVFPWLRFLLLIKAKQPSGEQSTPAATRRDEVPLSLEAPRAF